MKKYYLVLLTALLLLFCGVGKAQNYITVDPNSTRIGTRIQQREQWVTYYVLTDKEFEAKLKDMGPKEPTKDKIWTIFHLPKDSDKTEVYVRKDYVKAVQVKKIHDFIYNVLYIYSFRADVPLGYHDMSMYQDSTGNWEFSLENNFNTTTTYQVVGNMILFNNHFNSPRRPMGSFQGSLVRSVERAARNEESFLYFIEKNMIQDSLIKEQKVLVEKEKN